MAAFRHAAALLVAAPLIVASAVWAQQPQSTGGVPKATNAAAAETARQAMKQAMTRMDRDMSAAPAVGDVDQTFAAKMIPHHQGAIDMARIELKYGKDPTLRRLAQSIVTGQEREIRDMKRWQASHQHGK